MSWTLVKFKIIFWSNPFSFAFKTPLFSKKMSSKVSDSNFIVQQHKCVSKKYQMVFDEHKFYATNDYVASSPKRAHK